MGGAATPVVPAFENPKQGDQLFEVSLGCLVRPPISKIKNRITERGKTAFGQQRVLKTSSAGPHETLVPVWGRSKGTVLPEAQ